MTSPHPPHLASPGQYALWQFHQLNPASPAYNMVAARELRADLDPAALCRAFSQVVEHCETLHCGYREQDGQLWMVRPEQLHIDASVQRNDDLDTKGVDAWIGTHADQPFDLAAANICRLRLLQCQGRLYLCMTAHHISGDFLSVEWMLKLTFSAYHAQINGEPRALPEPGVYFDWLREQRELLTPDKLAPLSDYWRNQLSGAPEALSLLPDKPRPRTPGYEGREFEVLLSQAQSDDLRALADMHNVSLFVLLAGLFQVFMHRYTDQDDFLIGTPTMDRHKARYKNLIGFTLNSLPLRARFDQNPTLAECLRDTAQQLREGLRHRRYPAARMQEDAGGGPLFQCMMTYMPSRRDDLFSEYSLQEHLFTQRGGANELNLRWQDDGARLLAQWRYRTDLFDAQRIARLAEDFAWFAAQAQALPGARVGDLHAAPPAHASTQVGRSRAPVFASAVAAFDHQVSTQGQRTALRDAQGTLTYIELNQAALELAHQLRAAGAGAGQVIALALPRSRTLITAMLASWKLSAAYLCLDPGLPASRQKQLLDDSGASVLIDPDHSIHALRVGATPNSATLPAPHPHQLAYLIYTSGSTGAPKAVCVTQGNLIHYADAVMQPLALSQDASLTALASVAADLGYTAWFGALLSGRTLHLIADEVAGDPEELARSLAATPVDCLKIVPSHLNALLAVADPQRLLPRQCLVLGGEGLDLGLVERLQAMAPGCRIINHYGPTETTVGCLTHTVDASRESLSGLAPIGLPLDNVDVHVLDRYLAPLPRGSAGELYIGGAGVADGYLGQPALTAQRFIPNPFTGDGQRLYRSGDRVRMLASGGIEFLGRIDDQVKIRGFRVEPGEVEACLRACAGIREAAVVARTLGDSDTVRLIAYVVTHTGLDSTQLQRQLATQLPEPMLPSHYVELDQLPRLGNGKVDRHALPIPAPQQPHATPQAAPRDAVEAQLLDLWCKVLGKASLSIHDDFFALGGDSILALQLIAAARKAQLKFTPKHFFAHPTVAQLAATLDTPTKQLESQLTALWQEVLQREAVSRQDDFFALGGDSIIALQLIAKARKQGLRFTPKEFFAHPCIAALAELLSGREPAPAAPPAAPTLVRSVAPDAAQHTALQALAGTTLEDAYALSPLQKGLLFHSLLEGGNGVYVNQLQAELQGPLQPERYLAAWHATFAAHPLMRTAVLWQGLDEPMQGVCSDVQLPVQRLDWSTLDEPQREQALAEYCQADRAQGFDPQRPPLQRIALIHLDQQRTWLVWSRHHLIADGWSSVMLMEEILARYNGLPVSPRPPYRDYIDWLAAQPLAQSQAYWQQRLDAFEGAGTLPALNPTDSFAEPLYYTRRLQLSEAQTHRLNLLGKTCRVTLNTLMQAAWGLLLARHNNQADVMFGVTSSGRPGDLPDAGQMLGVFINTLPLRLQAAPDLSLADYLHQVQSTSVAMREHEHTPLADILQQHPRGAGLFDTLLVFQNLPALSERQLQSGDLTLKVLDNLEQTSYGLTVEVLPGRCLEVLFSADAQRLAQPSLQTLIDHLHALLLALDTAPDTRLEQLSIHTAQDRQRLLDWGTHTGSYSLEPCWEQRVAAQVAAHPQRVVARCGEHSLTYAALWQRSHALACGLQAMGAVPDQPVVLLAQRGIEWLCLIVATLRANCAWLPLEPSQPPARWSQVLERLEQPLVICTPQYRERLTGVYAGRHALPAELEALSPAGHLPRQPARNDQLAYVLFTSGSTGQPKGVMVTRAGMLNNMLAKQVPLGLTQDDVIAQTAPACFDISVWQTLTAPLFGACVEIIDDDTVRDPLALINRVQARQVSLLEPVPALLQAMLESQAQQPAPLPHLRWVLPTGEALPVATAQQWLQHYPHIPLMNAYGPAECSDDVAFQPLYEAPLQGSSVAIGRPTANAELYVLGQDLQPVPAGVVGELAIGGIGVSRGYLADPSRTAASFIPNPFGAKGSRLYLSGDLARWGQDGVLEYLGRKDFQLKLRGFRIEPGEIEAHLERHPDVLRAVVNLQRPGGSEMLVGYWQGRSGHGLDGSVLSQFVRDSLPAYMVPSLWVQMDTWPQNANGKVDRKALPLPTMDTLAVEPLGSASEHLLAELWATLLPPQRLGRNSHFFEAGGHSLLATRLIARIRQRCAVEMPLRGVFDAPLLWQLAERLDSLSAQPAGLASSPLLQRVERQAHMPLSLSQHRLWMIDRLNGPSAAYNMAATLSLHGRLNLDALRATFNALLERHEVLRTAYSDVDGEPVSVITPQMDLDVPLHDVSHLDEAQRQAVADQHSLGNLRLPFDMAQAPLIRVSLLKLGEDRHLLFLALHHMVADGWSVGVLINELSQLYTAFDNRQDTPLPALAVQYADYAAWQRECLQGERLDREVAFWQAHLHDAPQVLQLPTDWPRPAQADARGAAKALEIPAPLLSRLDALALAEGVSLYMLLLSTFEWLMHQVTGDDDLVLGTDVAGREDTRLEGLIGFFVNVLPLRSRRLANDGWRDFLNRTRDTCLEAFEHQALPFDRIVEALQVPRERSRNPLVQALFVLQNTPDSTFSMPGLTVQMQAPTERTSKFDMALFLERHGDVMRGDWVYARALFKGERIDALISAWLSLLHQVVDHPDAALTQLTVTLPSVESPALVNPTPPSSKLDKLKKMPARAPAPKPLIRTRALLAGRDFPLLIEPGAPDLDPVGWAHNARDLIDTLLCQHGGLLFRGFALDDAKAFEAFAEAIHPGLFGGYGDLPKKEGGRNIYRSTPYPEREMILFHNESSHLPRSPRKQWFFCEQPSPVGGATPIVDCRELYRRLPAELAERFERKGLLYVRTFTERLDVNWREFFKTGSRAEVEALCQASGTELRWLANDELQTRTRCPAVIRHPLSGERSFFNQIQLHHTFSLEPQVREDLLRMVGEERMPRQVFFGDGSPIDDATMALLGRLYEDCAVRFEWQRGDVVMLDNLLAAHARDPFEGPRKIVVAMGDMHAPADLASHTHAMELQD